MKILLSWLNDYIEKGFSAEDTAEILSDLGFPSEGIEYLDSDAVLDVEITSNRGDCLGYIGVARELAAVMDKELKVPSVKLVESGKKVEEFVSVEIADADLCGRYTAGIIEGVKVGPSLDWMRERLEAVGVRSVNNVVDATNYAMLETGQPPHAFDYEKIAEGKIIVRKALVGERITSIDGSKCELDTEMLIIADAKGPVAIAGVMGGLETEVSDSTVNILLEDAHFEPVSVRTTSRKLSLPSEAAFRFERIVDIEKIEWASKRTAQLIIEAAGGKAAGGIVDVYPRKLVQKKIGLRISRLNKLLGVQIPVKEAVGILSRLNFEPKANGDTILCVVPSWRSDVYREADLIEEVARVYGYNKVPVEKKIKIEVVPVDVRQKMLGQVGTYLNGCGYYETVNVTFIDDDGSKLFAESSGGEYLGVKDVSRKSANLLRQSLMGSLLGVLKMNLNAKTRPCRIFEIADTFVPAESEGALPNEKTKLALVCDGEFRDIKGVVEGLIKAINRETEAVFVPAEIGWAEAGAQIVVEGTVLGAAGVVSEEVKEKFDFKEVRPCAAEVDFGQLMALGKGVVKVKPIAKYPAIERDLSLIVDEEIAWSDIESGVKRGKCEKLEEIRYVGIYRGKGIGDGKKSVTLTLTFRDDDGTLTHGAVDGFEKGIVKGLAESVRAELRTA